MLHFATFFDRNYLTRGLALLESLTSHCSKDFRFYVLALDMQVIDYFRKLGNEKVVTIALQDLEQFFPELREVKKQRSTIEYYFTLSPFLPLYILKHFQQVDMITTMDADLLFFDDPNLIFEKYPHASVLITPHNFSAALQESVKYGKYNVSFQSFRRDENGVACLENWRAKCAEWCFDELDEKNNRFADQKYLDSWVRDLKNVQEINIPGTGVSPWNVEKFQYKIVDGKIFVDGCPLIYFHFHHLRIFNSWFAMNGLRDYKVTNPKKAISLIYHTYLKRLRQLSRRITVTENKIHRNNYVSGGLLIRKLLQTDGYWFFTPFFIVHLNPHRAILQLKNSLRKTNG